MAVCVVAGRVGGVCSATCEPWRPIAHQARPASKASATSQYGHCPDRAPAPARSEALAILLPAADATAIPLLAAASALSIRPAAPSWFARPDGIAATI